jgi:hypothetical protein
VLKPAADDTLQRWSVSKRVTSSCAAALNDEGVNPEVLWSTALNQTQRISGEIRKSARSREER